MIVGCMDVTIVMLHSRIGNVLVEGEVTLSHIPFFFSLFLAKSMIIFFLGRSFIDPKRREHNMHMQYFRELVIVTNAWTS